MAWVNVGKGESLVEAWHQEKRTRNVHVPLTEFTDLEVLDRVRGDVRTIQTRFHQDGAEITYQFNVNVATAT